MENFAYAYDLLGPKYKNYNELQLKLDKLYINLNEDAYLNSYKLNRIFKKVNFLLLVADIYMKNNFYDQNIYTSIHSFCQ